MFKKILAAAMSAMMLLYPLSASAISWFDVCSTMYPVIEKGEKNDSVALGGGSASFDKQNDTYVISLKDLDIPDEYLDLSLLCYPFTDNGKCPDFEISNLDMTLENIKANNFSVYIAEDDHFKIKLNGSTAVKNVWIYAEDNAVSELTNHAVIRCDSDYLPISLDGNGTHHFDNHGTLESFPISLDSQDVNVSASIILNMSEDSATPENIRAIVDGMDLNFGSDPVNILVEVYDLEGDYQIDYFIVVLEPKTVVDNGPSPEMIRHWKELERQEKAIGGVYGSPYWLKQLSLGYHSLNLRLYLDGEQVNFKQDLGWAGEGPDKELILRINHDDPEKLTMRLDEFVLETLERTEFALITLKEKDGGIVMQYNVSDLRAAYEQYGLDGSDLLSVGSADDPVMKIGADGELKPIEE